MRQHLAPKLRPLHLSGILYRVDVRSQQAINEHQTYDEFLEPAPGRCNRTTAAKQLSLRVRRATLAGVKTLKTFDFGFNPAINRQKVHDLATGNFIRDVLKVLICGSTGAGKRHLAESLAHAACRSGFDVVFTNARTMLQRLHAGRADKTFEKRLAAYGIRTCW